jgi:hypothetical protein
MILASNRRRSRETASYWLGLASNQRCSKATRLIGALTGIGYALLALSAPEE